MTSFYPEAVDEEPKGDFGNVPGIEPVDPLRLILPLFDHFKR